jgi:hypothetical protein
MKTMKYKREFMDRENYDDSNRFFDHDLLNELESAPNKMTYNEFYHMVKIINSTENVGDKLFWETPEFDESDFEIIDNTIRFKEGILINNDANSFFLEYVKPLVDTYLANHSNEINEEVDENSYERAMSLLK